MEIISCGIIPYHIDEEGTYWFLVGHPGGNFTKHKDIWTLFKGQKEGNESDLECAIREFKEETGLKLLPNVEFIDLGTVKQNTTKKVHAYAYETVMFSTNNLHSNLAEKYGWPEIDRYEWKTFNGLKDKVHKSHVQFYQGIINKKK